MKFFIGFSPIFLFICVFVGSGLYFTHTGVDQAFYQLSPTVAIIPAIVLGWLLCKGSVQKRMQTFLDGVRHRDIITMCLIFVLAGAFSTVTRAIGSVDATVNLALSVVPPNLLLVGVFLSAGFISTAIGTSMGAIAAFAPITVGLSAHGAFSPEMGMATVIGGAMLGDNLSLISDTTIAAVASQETNMKDKFKLNAQIALIALVLTCVCVYFMQDKMVTILAKPYTLLPITPYIILIALAVSGMNIFISLVCSILFAWCVGYIESGYTLITLSQDMAKGFESMHEIMLLSLMVGGLSSLVGEHSKKLAMTLADWSSRRGNQKVAQLMIAKIVSVFDILLANNTVAIIFSGDIARNLADKNRIPRHYSAVWLDTFSSVFQGLIPYGAQMLLASSIAGVSPLSIVPYVYYCYILFFVSFIYIILKNKVK